MNTITSNIDLLVRGMADIVSFLYKKDIKPNDFGTSFAQYTPPEETTTAPTPGKSKAKPKEESDDITTATRAIRSILELLDEFSVGTLAPDVKILETILLDWTKLITGIIISKTDVERIKKLKEVSVYVLNAVDSIIKVSNKTIVVFDLAMDAITNIGKLFDNFINTLKRIDFNGL